VTIEPDGISDIERHLNLDMQSGRERPDSFSFGLAPVSATLRVIGIE
jgi:hypothetical protein